MNKVVLCAILILGFAIADSADARVFGRRRSTGSTYSSVPMGGDNSTAQGVAEIMAKIERVGHFGGNRGFEGCGSGPTPEAAYNNTCYANSVMPTVDSGVAQGRSGRWYCCRRFVR